MMSDDEHSVESLLSNWNEEEEKEEEYDGDDEFERLKHKFAFRDKLLKRMSEGKDTAVVQMLMHHEELMRGEAFKLLEEEKILRMGKGEDIKDEDEKSNGNQYVPENKNSSEKSNGYQNVTENKNVPASTSTITGIKSAFLFETRLAFPGLLTLICYCFTHLSAYQFVDSLIGECPQYLPMMSEDVFYALCIFMSLFLTRLTGGVWVWVNLERHEMAKFDLHNRVRLGYWDAKLHLWFRQHETIKFILDNFAIYVCLVGVAYFQFRLFAPLFEDRTWILDKLPSRAYDNNIETSVYKRLIRAVPPKCHAAAAAEESCSLLEEIKTSVYRRLNRAVPPSTCHHAAPAIAGESCSLVEEMNRQDEDYLWSIVSASSYMQLIGYDGAYAATPFAIRSFSFCLSCFGFYVLKKLGYKSD